VTPGDVVELGTFRLPPPLARRTLHGSVRWPSGDPAPDTLVRLELPGRDLRGLVEQTGADGGFSFEVFAGCTYGIRAVHEEGAVRFVAESAPIAVGESDAGVELRLRLEDRD
jgi:hypothetical protein